MSPVLSRSRLPSVGTPSRRFGLVLVVALAVVGGILLTPLLEAPPRVPRITVQNPQQWDARVDVGGTSGGRVPVGTVEAGATRTFHEVLDHDATWTFRFSYVGVSDEVTLTREDLVQSGWTVVVPAKLAERLRQAGVAPSP